MPKPAVCADPAYPANPDSRPALSPRLDNVEYRPGAAAFPGWTIFKIHTFEGIVFEHQTAQLAKSTDKIRAPSAVGLSRTISAIV